MKEKVSDWNWFYQNRYSKSTKSNFVCDCGFVSTIFKSKEAINIPIRHSIRFGNIKSKTLDYCDNCKSILESQYFERFKWQSDMAHREKVMTKFLEETNKKMQPSTYLKWLEEQIYVY